MTTARKITNYRNDATGELAPPHVLGTDEGGATLYQGIEGWTPVDGDGTEVEVATGADGDWTVMVAGPPNAITRRRLEQYRANVQADAECDEVVALRMMLADAPEVARDAQCDVAQVESWVTECLGL